MTIMDRLIAIGPADYRPCGCVNDPGVFGHIWSGCQAGKDRDGRDL